MLPAWPIKSTQTVSPIIVSSYYIFGMWKRLLTENSSVCVWYQGGGEGGEQTETGGG